MISARFQIQLPDGLWVTEISQQYPQATFRLLSGYQIDDHAIELGETVTDHTNEITEAIRTHPSVSDYELLESTKRRILSKYKTSDTQLYTFVESASLTIEFPVAVQDGQYEFNLTGTRNELNRLEHQLDSSPLSYELEYLVNQRDTDELLTNRQKEILETAIREGYFEVPRECTLAELAETLDLDKSTVSTILRRGEGRVLKWFVTRPIP